MRLDRYLVFVLLVGIIVFSCESKNEKSQQADQMKTAHQNLAAGGVKFDAPEGWVKEAPASSMRKAQYRWPGVDGAEDAVLAVFFFPGTGGPVDANLNRWYGQFKQPDGSQTSDHVEKKTSTVNGLPVTTVYVTGTYLKPQSPMTMSGPKDEMKDYALLAAIVVTDNGPWFFKATGPQKTIDHWRPAFQKFVKTFRVEK